MAKLLLVEDDNNLREIYEARLQAEGYTIVSAKDGEEALVVAKAEKPDLVISDVMMPKISGFEMLDILRNTDELKGVKVIMLTALGQSDDQQRADKLGADRYLVKSQVTLEDIVKVTHELLEGDAAPAADATAADASKTDTPAPAAAPAAPPTDDAAKTDAATPAPAPEPVAEPPAAEPPAAAPAAEEPKEEPKPEPAAPEVKPEPTPEVKAETVVEPPAATPAADDATKTDAADTTKPDADATASNDAAKPAAEEEADVEAKIEDFVAGASSEPTTPAGDKPADTTAKPDAAAPAATAASTSDDKLMADAVEKLVASTDKTDEKKEEPAPAGDAAPSAPAAPAAKSTVIPVSITPDADAKPAAPATTPPATEPAKEEKKEDKDEAAAKKPELVGGNRVIKPLESTEKKKDINQLLADEEAKEAGAVPGATIVGDAPKEEDAEDRPAGQPASSPGSVTAPAAKSAPGEVDPNSIAL